MFTLRLKLKLGNIFSFVMTLSASAFNTRGAGLLQLSPLQISPCSVFAFWLGLSFSQFTHHLSRYPRIYEKNSKSNLGCNNSPHS